MRQRSAPSFESLGSWQHLGMQKNQMTPAGLEPAIPGSVGRCLIHWATGPYDIPRNVRNAALAFFTFKDSTSGVAQWLACWAHNPKVRGSKPRSATFMPLVGCCSVLPTAAVSNLPSACSAAASNSRCWRPSQFLGMRPPPPSEERQTASCFSASSFSLLRMGKVKICAFCPGSMRWQLTAMGFFRRLQSLHCFCAFCHAKTSIT